jgi:hypothetical protein
MGTLDQNLTIGRREVTGGLIASILALPLTLATRPASAREFEPLWRSARVLIGNSPEDQIPSPVIECPLFFEDGRFAKGFHTLDLSEFPTSGQVRGTISHRNDTIEPDFGSSIAADVTLGSDGIPYLLVGGEGTVTNGQGSFRSVDRVIVRCKYKVAPPLLLIACVDCVIILVQG